MMYLGGRGFHALYNNMYIRGDKFRHETLVYDPETGLCKGVLYKWRPVEDLQDRKLREEHSQRGLTSQFTNQLLNAQEKPDVGLSDIANKTSLKKQLMSWNEVIDAGKGIIKSVLNSIQDEKPKKSKETSSQSAEK